MKFWHYLVAFLLFGGGFWLGYRLGWADKPPNHFRLVSEKLSDPKYLVVGHSEEVEIKTVYSSGKEWIVGVYSKEDADDLWGEIGSAINHYKVKRTKQSASKGTPLPFLKPPSER